MAFNHSEKAYEELQNKDYLARQKIYEQKIANITKEVLAQDKKEKAPEKKAPVLAARTIGDKFRSIMARVTVVAAAIIASCSANEPAKAVGQDASAKVTNCLDDAGSAGVALSDCVDAGGHADLDAGDGPDNTSSGPDVTVSPEDIAPKLSLSLDPNAKELVKKAAVRNQVRATIIGWLKNNPNVDKDLEDIRKRVERSLENSMRSDSVNPKTVDQQSAAIDDVLKLERDFLELKSNTLSEKHYKASGPVMSRIEMNMKRQKVLDWLTEHQVTSGYNSKMSEARMALYKAENLSAKVASGQYKFENPLEYPQPNEQAVLYQMLERFEEAKALNLPQTKKL